MTVNEYTIFYSKFTIPAVINRIYIKLKIYFFYVSLALHILTQPSIIYYMLYNKKILFIIYIIIFIYNIIYLFNINYYICKICMCF